MVHAMGIPDLFFSPTSVTGEGCLILRFPPPPPSPSSSAQLSSAGSVFAGGPQPRSSIAIGPQLRYRTSTAIICGQCSLSDLNQQKECQKELKECQKRCQTEDVRRDASKKYQKITSVNFEPLLAAILQRENWLNFCCKQAAFGFGATSDVGGCRHGCGG